MKPIGWFIFGVAVCSATQDVCFTNVSGGKDHHALYADAQTVSSVCQFNVVVDTTSRKVASWERGVPREGRNVACMISATRTLLDKANDRRPLLERAREKMTASFLAGLNQRCSEQPRHIVAPRKEMTTGEKVADICMAVIYVGVAMCMAIGTACLSKDESNPRSHSSADKGSTPPARDSSSDDSSDDSSDSD